MDPDKKNFIKNPISITNNLNSSNNAINNQFGGQGNFDKSVTNIKQLIPTPSQGKDNIYDVDYENLGYEDRPWRKPGADPSDYFNYGFNDDTWLAYCIKKRKKKAEQSMQEKIGVYEPDKEDSPADYPPELQDHGPDNRSKRNNNFNRNQWSNQTNRTRNTRDDDQNQGDEYVINGEDSNVQVYVSLLYFFHLIIF